MFAKKHHSFFLLCLLCWPTQHACYADDAVLRAALPSFPPFAYPGEKEERGSVVTYLRMLEKEADIKIDILYIPYVRIAKDLRLGNVDFSVTFENRELADAAFVDGIVSYSDVLVVTRPEVELNNYQDMYRLKRVGVIKNARFGKPFDDDNDILKYGISNYQQGLRMMRFKRLDAIVGSLSGLKYSTEALQIDFDEWGSVLALGQKAWALHFSKKSKYQYLRPRIKKAVAALYKPKLLYELYEQANPEAAELTIDAEVE